jgi:hypothetical protein
MPVDFIELCRGSLAILELLASNALINYWVRSFKQILQNFYNWPMRPEFLLLNYGDSIVPCLPNLCSYSISFFHVILSFIHFLFYYCRKAEKITRAIECFKSSLKHNPLLWSSFETLCKLGNHYLWMFHVYLQLSSNTVILNVHVYLF